MAHVVMNTGTSFPVLTRVEMGNMSEVSPNLTKQQPVLDIDVMRVETLAPSTLEGCRFFQQTSG